MRLTLIAAVGVLMALPSTISLRAGQQTDLAVTLPANATGRPPAAVVIENQSLADGLRAEGVATVAVASDISASVAAITQLRNDPRFSTITIIGPGTVSAEAARTARADGFWSTAGGAPGPASSVIASLAATTTPDARAIAAWIRELRPVRHPATQRASLRDTVVADLGGSRITIEYGGPSKRNRTIWGTLVPWGRWWMPGADEATVITNAVPIVIGTLAVPAGEHTLYTMPGADEFTLIINNAVGVFHTEYFQARDLGRVPMAKSPVAEPVERLTFAFETNSAGLVLKMLWDDRQYSVPVTLR